MSLKTFLAVGESFSGTDEKSYGLKAIKEQQIPIFATTAEAEAKEESQSLVTSAATDAGQMTLGPQVEPVREPERRIHITPERRRIETEPDERRRFLKRWSKPTIRRLTQAEMTLANVQVVRNDLSDSDLELAPRRAARAAQNDLNPFAPRPIAAIGRPAHEKLGMGERVARWFRFLKKPRS
ncbi:MAG TPA: hypothetical protein VM680_04560 [Verrucomicrobiae bacterium]|nr:hypothetical protein [Verrucomicrobiae bacterium]